MKKRILFVCVENAGRSQIAEAFAKEHVGGDIEALSAGTVPAENVYPEVVQVMNEKGINLSANKPKMLDLRMAEDADVIVSMGCTLEGLCPAPLLKKAIDWGLEDPKGKPTEKVREIRDQIERNVVKLVSELRKEAVNVYCRTFKKISKR